MSGYFPREEYEDRWVRVLGEMARRGYDAAVVFGKTASNFERAGDVLYLSGYMSTKVGQPYDTADHIARAYSAVILRQGHEPWMVVDDPGFVPDDLGVKNVRWNADTIGGVIAALKDLAVRGRTAFVGSDFFAVKYYDRLLSETPAINWETVDDLVLDIRRRKSPREQEACREAGDISATAMTLLMNALVAGRSEAEAAGEAAREITRRGGIPHRINCTSGDRINASCRSALTGYSTHVAAPGDMVKGWIMGPMFQGYYMDPGRTAVVGGRPDREQRRVIEACADMVAQLARAVRPGVSYKDVADLGDRLKAEFGGAKDPGEDKHPFYGHPNGLYFEGPPYVSNSVGHEGAVFHKGDLIGLEAFLNTGPSVGAGFEQNYIVTEDGVELITPAPVFWH